MEKNNEIPMKKGSKWLGVVVAILIIAILAGVAYYFLKPTSPKDVFVSGINSALESSTKELGEDVKKINTTVILSGNIESSNEEINKIAQYINQGKLTYGVQFDKEAKKALLNLSVDYQNENLISGKMYYAAGDENVYIYIQDLFDKYFKFNIKENVDDEESVAILENLFNGETSTLKDKVDVKKMANLLKTEIENNLKDDYFSKEKVDGMTKNTMKLTVSQLKEMVKNIATSLKDNNEFLSCFEADKRDEIKEGIEELVDELDDVDAKYDSKNIEFSIYTNGMKNQFEKFEIKTDAVEAGQILISIAETDKDKYEINADIPEVGKAKLNMDVKNDTEVNINENVADSIEINNMTQAEQMKLLGNLMNMKLYQYLAPFMQSGM